MNKIRNFNYWYTSGVSFYSHKTFTWSGSLTQNDELPVWCVWTCFQSIPTVVPRLWLGLEQIILGFWPPVLCIMNNKLITYREGIFTQTIILLSSRFYHRLTVYLKLAHLSREKFSNFHWKVSSENRCTKNYWSMFNTPTIFCSQIVENHVQI